MQIALRRQLPLLALTLFFYSCQRPKVNEFNDNNVRRIVSTPRVTEIPRLFEINQSAK